MSWSLLLLAGLLVFWLLWRQKNRRLLKMASSFPGPPALPLLGNALSFNVRPEELPAVIRSMMDKYGAAYRVWLGPDLNIFISEPDDLKTSLMDLHEGQLPYSSRLAGALASAVRDVDTPKDAAAHLPEVLLTNPKTSVKGPVYKYMAEFTGDGILSGSGPKWRKHRKIAMPNYGKRAIETYNGFMNQEIDYLLPKLRKLEVKQKGRNLNIYKEVVKTTSYVFCQTLMGLSREQTLALPRIQELIDATPNLYKILFDRMTRWYLQIEPLYWLSDTHRQMKEGIEVIHAVCSGIINLREEALRNNKGLALKDLDTEEDSPSNTELSVIDRFILSGVMTREDLIRSTFTVFTSSQEATAKITSAMLLMLALHPECQAKLYEEIKSVMGDDDRWLTHKDLSLMPYLDMAFCETIRLFPIGATIQRTVTEDITISSGTLPAGCSLVVPVYHMQRDPRFWTDPDAFDPERFSPEQARLRHPNCYMPFSLGPMDCLGRDIGKKMIKMICGRVLREFMLTSTDSYKDLQLSIAISTSPINGFNVILNRRN